MPKEDTPVTQRMLNLVTSELTHLIRSIEYKLDAFAKKFDSLEHKLDSLDHKVGSLETMFDARFKSVDSQLEAIHASVSRGLILAEEQKAQNGLALEPVKIEPFPNHLSR